jgi:CheY-like chemotaxis protein
MTTAMKVLVIDDEEGIRDLFKEYLGILGHDADVAGDGAGALALLGERRYDLVLTDLIMPGMSGLAVAQTVRRQLPELRIIVISGSADQFDIQQVEHAGVGYLHKPVSFAQFRRAVCPDDWPA